LKTGKPHRWEVTTSDGATIIDVYDFPFTDVDGSKLILEMDVDITDRKRAESALEESEAMLRSILRTVSVGIGVVKNRVFEWTNETYRKITGFSESELKGKSTRMVYPDDEEFKRAGLMYEIMKKHGVGVIETKHKNKNGNIIDVMINIAQIIPGDLNSGIAFTLLDITERKNAEKEISEISEDLSLLADINSLANAGTNIEMISQNLSAMLKRIYNCEGAAILLLDSICQTLILQNSPFNNQQKVKIESLLQQKLTGIRIKISSDTMPWKMFINGDPILLSSVNEIQQAIHGNIKNPLMRKHAPSLVKLLGIKSMIIIPLMTENKPIGLIEISSKNIFSQNTLKRISGLSKNLANIIARKQTEILLKEQEEMLRIINENVSDIIWRIDADTRITYLSPSFERILGYRPEEILGQPILNFIAKEYHHFAANNIRKRASQKKENKLIYYEYEMVARDGRKIPIEVSSSAIRDDQGNLTGFAGVSRDINERNAAERALKESERKYRNLFENMVQGAFYQDTDGNLTDVNKAALEIFGISRAQFLDSTSMHPEWNVVDEKNRFLPGAEHPSMLALETGKKIRNKVLGVFNPKKGSYIWMQVNALPQFKPGEQKPYEVFVTLNDISAIKKAEENLRDSETRFRELFSSISSGVAIYVYDPVREDYLFKDINMAGMAISQIKHKSDILNKYLLECFPGAKELGLWDTLNMVRSNGISQKVPKIFYKDERIYLYVENFVYKLPSNEMVVVYNDISEKVLAEKNILRHYNEIKKLTHHLEYVREEERKMIARDLHDDLGQILTAVKMDISWIRKRIPVEKGEIKKRSESAIQIIDQAIQSIRRISSELRPVILDNLGLFETLKAHIRDYENRFKIIVNYKFPETEPEIKSDQQISVFRIVQEALTNTARHSGATAVDLDIREKDNNLKILIRDNGIGIPDQKLYSTDSFGLISMRERVLQWEGKITVRGKENEGTAINVSIPLK
jgi:PAS domain S-box-containing protein